MQTDPKIKNFKSPSSLGIHEPQQQALADFAFNSQITLLVQLHQDLFY